MKVWPLALYRVSGESMYPTLLDGDLVVGWRWFSPRPSQIVIARRSKLIIKRIKTVQGHDIWLEGDNLAASIDSRSFGLVHKSSLEALIIKVLK